MVHLPSGRVYIGQRKVPRNKTVKTDSYFGSGKIWKQIYKKHSDECIKVIIDFANTKDEIDELEKKYIAHYKSVYKEFCVNITDGGQTGGMKGKKHSEITKLKMSIMHEGEKNHFYGKKHSPETRAKMSDSLTLSWKRRKGEKLTEHHNRIEARKEYMKEYRLKHKSEHREYMKEYRLKHKIISK